LAISGGITGNGTAVTAGDAEVAVVALGTAEVAGLALPPVPPEFPPHATANDDTTTIRTANHRVLCLLPIFRH